VGKAVVGQDEAVTGLLIGLLCGGHVLLEGVPGVAKTLLVRSLATSLALASKRVQFTPDLMPGDVTGSLVYNAGEARFDFRPGPVFSNLLLADEINRTPPKTQAALLEAMEERQVTVDGTSHPLPGPFMVIATQNPVEYEGTYPLPEDEIGVVARHAAGFDPRDLAGAGLGAVTDADELQRARAEVERVRVDWPVLGYIVDICRATRSAPSVSLGASPRAATALMRTSRAWAWLNGRDFVTPDDVKALATATLNHRLQVRTEAQLDGTSAAAIIANVVATLPVPR
jgi:MoxR-like ATPase